jgi:probable phosphoglycerate mutase
LTAAGRAQAASVTSRLSPLDFGMVWTSPLKRAVETASLAGFDDAGRDPDLVEWDYGTYDGLTTTEIRKRRPGWEIFRDGVMAGEALAHVAERADRVIERVRALDGDALVVSHGHFSRVLTARWLGLAAENGRTFAMSPASLSMLGHKREVPVVLRWNDACHIEDEWCSHSVFPE